MSASKPGYPRWQWAMLVVGSLAALGLASFIVSIDQYGTDASVQTAAQPSAGKSRSKSVRLGVLATLTAGDVSVQRQLPTMAFSLTPEQSLDSRLPAGPFTGVFDVTFLPGEVEEATIGAVFQGGSLIIRRGEESQHLIADHAGDEPKQVMSTLPLGMTRRAQTIVYEFSSEGNQPVSLRALWQPDTSEIPLPLPSDGAPLLDSNEVKGFALAQQFNCAACHISADEELQRVLALNPAPVLGEIGQRARPAWIRKWLSDPQSVKVGAAMPRLLHDLSGADAETLEDLTHFLASLSGPLQEPTSQPDRDLIATGMVQYHTIGCFACHGPLEPTEKLPGGYPSRLTSFREYVPLGLLGEKTTTKHLASFLRDPLKHRPSGRMPSQNLSAIEADAIASYLMARGLDSVADEGSQQLFALDQNRVERGRTHFAALGCANCHVLGPNQTAIESTLAAAPLESLSGNEVHGCLAARDPLEANSRAPDFALTRSQRQALGAILNSLSERRETDVPHDMLAADMSRLNCAACHQYHGERGPEPFSQQYFAAIAEADLGDEGRLPPNLSLVGAKLNSQWIRDVLEQSGTARPYMGARMPQYGEQNVREFPARFASAAGVWPVPDHGPATPKEYASIGRELVGSKGLNCIQCHTIAGEDATGTPGPDLATMAERLRYENFARWLYDPAQVRPGTRMPSFFVGGKSAVTQYLRGDAAEQIDAIWSYLSLGKMLPLPEGLVDRASLKLRVDSEPIVLRTFMKQAGVRAIACGFPEQIHCAFDADNCRLAMIWEGEFINAAGAWANRGGTETNPVQSAAWTNEDGFAVRVVGQGGSVTPQAARFRGYRFDEKRRPVFLYDIECGGATVRVQEQPIPVREDGRAKMIRKFTFRGPPGLELMVSDRSFVLNESGVGEFVLEVTW